MLKSPFNIVKTTSKHFSVCSSDAVFRLFTVTGLTDVTHALQHTVFIRLTALGAY